MDLDDHAITLGSSTSDPIIVSKELLRTLVNLIFWSGDPDRLDKLMHPFFIIYISAAKKSQDHPNRITCDLLSSDGYLSLKDIQLFQLILKSIWPADFLHLNTTFKSFHNLLVVLLKPNHLLCVSYQLLLSLWTGVIIQISEKFGLDPAKPAPFLCHTLALNLWSYTDCINLHT